MDNLDSEIVREYDEKKKEVEHLKGQIQNNELGDKNYVKEIKAVYNKWYPKIFEIISTINSHFSDFMQSMGYVGEVKLIRKEEVFRFVFL
ncbi:hypothetical protein DOY81_007602 [Sarcophaga bullata]|nr:hypothetical protein DOY81_007602 [Sarcophaga bullata]